MTYFFETYGCQMNKAESDALESVLAARGWKAAEGPEAADFVLINTCSVRVTAEERIWGRLGYYARLKRDRKFVLALSGCMAERLKESAKERAPALDYVIGNFAKASFPQIAEAAERGELLPRVDEEPSYVFAPAHSSAGFRAFLPIMHGCDNYCAYCIVPYVRGRETSREPAAVLAELASLGERGVKEVTLLGQNVNSYRSGDLDFPGLLSLVAENAGGVEWIRFLSSHPKDLSDRAIEALAENPKLCKQLHLCAQSGSSRVLAAMNRKYDRDYYLALVDKLRGAVPEISLSTDILVGFPGETDAEYRETLSLMREVRFSMAYMYLYNPREGTRAFSMEGQVADNVKKERLAEVIALQRSISGGLMRARVGSLETVLVEDFSKRDGSELLGRTEREEMVAFPGPASLVGGFARVRLESLSGATFRGGLDGDGGKMEGGF